MVSISSAKCRRASVLTDNSILIVHKDNGLMASLNKDEISHKGKRIRKYSLEVKKGVITYAEKHGNRPASRQFQVDERRIREWRTKKSEIEGLVATEKGKQRSKLSGGGRKPLSAKLEKVLLEWIENRRARVSCKLIMKKAEITYRNMKESDNVDGEEFKASRGWLSRFMKRNGLSLRRKSSVAQQDLRDSLHESDDAIKYTVSLSQCL